MIQVAFNAIAFGLETHSTDPGRVYLSTTPTRQICIEKTFNPNLLQFVSAFRASEELCDEARTPVHMIHVTGKGFRPARDPLFKHIPFAGL